MKTFFLLNDKLGGAEQVMKQIASHYISQGQRVSLVFLSKQSGDSGWDKFSQNTSVFIVYLDKSLVKFNKHILRKKHEHLYTTHVYLTGMVGLFRRLRLLTADKLIGRESTSIFNRYSGLKLFTYKLCYNLGYPKLDLLICQSDLMRDQLLENLPWLDKKVNIKVIPNPFTLQNAPASVLRNDLSDFIVSAGRLIPEKGFDLLIEAFRGINDKFPEMQLIILGEGPDREKLENQVRERGLNSSVKLPGFVDNVYSYFKEAQICVVSSRIEGFPNVLLQMMSQNTKVVSTLCAGGIDNIQGVVLSQTHSVKELSIALEVCLTRTDHSTRALFDKELASRSIENFIISVNDAVL